MDAALWESPAAERLATATVHRVATLPFDHARRAASALLDDEGRRFLVVKGAPEQVMAKCTAVPDAAQPTLAALFDQRPSRGGGGQQACTGADRPSPPSTRCDLVLDGFLVFADEPKAAARDSLAQLTATGHRTQGGHRRQSEGRRKGMC